LSVGVAAEIAWWQLVLASVGIVGAFAGAFIVAFGVVDLVRPKLRSTIASAAGIEPALLDARPAADYRSRGRRRLVRGGAIAAVSFGVLWANVLLGMLD
jgi:hypothetical protein